RKTSNRTVCHNYVRVYLRALATNLFPYTTLFRSRHTGLHLRLFTWRSAAHARRGRDMTLRGIPARPNNANLGLSAVGVVAALFLLIVAFGSFTQVGVGEVGIVKHFGAIDPEHPDVFDPGIHTKVPFRDDVVIFDTRIQKEQVDASAASKDGVTIHSTIAVNFHIDASKAPFILQNLGPNYKDRIIDQQIQQAFKD